MNKNNPENPNTSNDRLEFDTKIKERIQNPEWDRKMAHIVYTRHHRIRRIYSIAAGLLLCLLPLSIWFFYNTPQAESIQAQNDDLINVLDVNWYTSYSNDEKEADQLFTTAVFIDNK